MTPVLGSGVRVREEWLGLTTWLWLTDTLVVSPLMKYLMATLLRIAYNLDSHFETLSNLTTYFSKGQSRVTDDLFIYFLFYIFGFRRVATPFHHQTHKTPQPLTKALSNVGAAQTPEYLKNMNFRLKPRHEKKTLNSTYTFPSLLVPSPFPGS